MNPTSNRAFAWLPVLAVLAGLALLAPKFEIPAFLQKKPQTHELEQAQQDLAAAKAAQAQAEARLQEAKADEESRKTDQLRYAQQTSAGAAEALGRVPEASRTPEVRLAGELVARTNVGLSAALGALPEAQRTEITTIVNQALSEKQAEVDAARAALAAKDAQLQASIADRTQLQAKIPVLEAAAQTKAAEVTVVSARVESATKQVADYAQKVADEKARAGSLDAYAGNLFRILLGIGALYFFIHFFLPLVAQSYPGIGWLTSLANAGKNLTTAHP